MRVRDQNLALVLIPCFVGRDLIRHRRIGTNAAVATAVAVTLAGLQHVVWISDVSYFDQISNPITVCSKTCPRTAGAVGSVGERLLEQLRKIAFVAGGALAAFGYVDLPGRVGRVPPLRAAVPGAGDVVASVSGHAFPDPASCRSTSTTVLLGVRRIDAGAERRWETRRRSWFCFSRPYGPRMLAATRRWSFSALPEGIGKGKAGSCSNS